MKDPTKSKMLSKFATNKPMMDSKSSPVAPKAGPDFDNSKTIAGRTSPRVGDRDGPAKKQAGEGNPKTPKTSAKAAKSGAPKTKQSPPSKVAPKVAGQPMMGAQMPMPSMPMGPAQAPPPNMIQAMKSTLGSNQKFTRSG